MDTRLVQSFADALASAPGTEQAPVPRFDRDDGVPSDVGGLLSAVGGWRHYDLRFIALPDLEEERQHWNGLATDFETGRSDNWSHAFWNRGWYPVACSSVELYAYDPLGCFGGNAGQIVCFDFKGGSSWYVFPSIDGWLEAFTAGLQRPEPDALYAARNWAKARRRLHEVALPQALDQQRAKTRFDTELTLRTFSQRVGDEAIDELDCTLYCLYALSRAIEPRRALGEIARALDAEAPHYDLRRLEAATLDDASELGRTWLVPLLEKHKSRKVSRLLFDIDFFDGRMDLWAWPTDGDGPATHQRSVSKASSPGFSRLHELVFVDSPAVHAPPPAAYEPPGWHARELIVAYAALLVRSLLDASASKLPWPGELDVMLFGWQLGRCDADGFVPTPLAIAREQLQSSRARTAAGLRKMGGPPPRKRRDHPLPADASNPERRLVHPDGRALEVTDKRSTMQFVMIESDGERDVFTRPIKTGWEVETLVAAQIRAGFVDTQPG